MSDPTQYDSSPADLTIQIELTAGAYTDVSDNVGDRENITFQRPKPGDPGRMEFLLDIPSGGVDIHEEQIVRVDDRTDPSQPYPRYWWGPIKEITYDVLGANEKIYDIVAYGPDQLLKEPPYQLTVPYTVGYAPWQPSKGFALGDVIQPNPTNGHKYTCTRAGTSGPTQPVFNATGSSFTNEPAIWAASTLYTAGDIVAATTSNGHKFKCTTGGTSGGTEPTWVKTKGANTTDGAVTWQEAGADDHPATWLSAHSYPAGSLVRPTSTNNHIYIATTGGTSGTGEPNPWPTASGGTYADGSVVWTEYGADTVYPKWQESGSAFVTDVTVLNDLLPRFLGTYVTYGGINNLMASVPYMQFPAGMALEDCLAEIAKYATSSTYNVTYPSWGAGLTYLLGTVIEPHVPNGHTYVAAVTTGDATSGGTEPVWPTTSGATIVDHNVTWKENGLIGRYIHNFRYLQGQVITPDAQPGYYFTSLDNGTSGGSDPVWPTTIGAIVADGTTAWVCTGQTSVIPMWQLSIPKDNVAHTASWTPDFSWFDLNNATEVPTLSTGYSDALVFDGSVLHWETLQLNRINTETANRVYVYGDNGSFAMKEDVARQNNENGHIRSLSITDTNLKTNGECSAAAANAIARLRARETVTAVAKSLPDSIAMRGLRKGKFTHALFGLSNTVYPLTDITVAMTDGIAEYTINAGDSFLDQTSDVLQSTLGGRANTRDTTAPGKVTFGADWVLDNRADPSSRTATLVLQFTPDGSADLSYFRTKYQVQGESFQRWGPIINYPNDVVTLANLPFGVGVTLYVLAYDTSGNPLFPLDSDWAVSPTVITASLPSAPPAPVITGVTSGPEGGGAGNAQVANYYADVTVDKANPSDDGSHGGVVEYHVGSGPSFHGADIPPGATYPYTARVHNLTPGGYDFNAAIIDQFDQISPYCADFPYTINVVPPTAPTLGTITDGVTRNGVRFLSVPVNHAVLADNQGGWVKVRNPGVGFDTLIPIAAGAPWPSTVTVTVPNVVANNAYDVSASVTDAWSQPSPFCTPVSHTIGTPPSTRPDPTGFDASHPDDNTTIAGWKPVSPSVIGDWSRDTTVTPFAGQTSLKLTIPRSTTKKIESPQYTCTPGETIDVLGAAIIDATAGSGAMFVQPYQQDGVTAVGSPLPVFTGATSTSFPTKLLDAKITMPALAYRFSLIYSGVGGASSTGHVWFAYPDFVRQIQTAMLAPRAVLPSNLGLNPTSGDPVIIYDENTLGTYHVYWSPTGNGVLVLEPLLGDPTPYPSPEIQIKGGTGSPSIVRIWDGLIQLQANGTRVGDAGTPTARAHIRAGSATAHTAPLKLDSGTLLTTPEAGASEYDGNAVFDTPVVDRHARVLSSAPITSTVSVSNKSTENTLFTGSISANELLVGRAVRLVARGNITNGISGDTTTIRVKVGGVQIFSISVATISATGACWAVDVEFTVRTTGSSGTIVGYLESDFNGTLGRQRLASATINTTTADDVTLTSQFSAANVQDQIQIDQAWLEFIH